jgi:tetratricopeptide (TPR) repeat protein
MTNSSDQPVIEPTGQYQEGLPEDTSVSQVEVPIGVNGKVDVLPLHDLESHAFETLIVRLVQKEGDIRGHAKSYGRQGQPQHGIDLYLNLPDGNLSVYQCKRYEKLTYTVLNAAVKMFVYKWQHAKGIPAKFVGYHPKKSTIESSAEKSNQILKPIKHRRQKSPPEWFQDISKFVVCTTEHFEKKDTNSSNSGVPLNKRDTKLSDAEISIKKELLPLGLEFAVWDSDEINTRLKSEPEIVETFFGIDGVKRFCLDSKAIPYLAGVEARVALLFNPEPVRGSPIQLLRPSNRVIRLAGRNTEWADLIAWCQNTDPFAVRAFTGLGGVGKTRLLLELCKAVEFKTWITGFAVRGSQQATDEVRWRELIALGRPLLIIVDYAEGNSATLRALCLAISLVPEQNRPRIRLVLLARAIGEWYQELRLFPGVGELLPSHQSGHSDSFHQILSAPQSLENPEAALQEFNFALNVFTADYQTDKAVLQPPISMFDESPNILFVHALALLASQGHYDGEIWNADHVFNSLLELEERYIASRLKPNDERSLVVRLMQTMTLVTLGYPVSNLRDAANLIALDSNLAALTPTPNEQERLARILHDTYPGESYIHSIEPDLLAEHLVFKQLTHPETGAFLIETAFGQVQPQPGMVQVNPVTAVEHLVRVAQWKSEPTINSLWSSVFTGRLSNISSITGTPLFRTLILAVQAAPSRMVGSRLAEFIARDVEASGDTELANAINESIPQYSLSLLQLSETIAKIAASAVGVSALTRQYNYAARLLESGKFDQALAKSQKVTAEAKRLLSANPDRYTHIPILSQSLIQESQSLFELGKVSEGLATTTEVIELLRKFRLDVAVHFLAQAPEEKDTIDGSGKRQKVLVAVIKSNNSDLAESLNNLELMLDALLPDLGGALLNRATFLVNQGALDDAQADAEESVGIFRDREKRNPPRIRPSLAIALMSLSNVQSALVLPELALESQREAIDILKGLVTDEFNMNTFRLAAGLVNLAGLLTSIDDWENALLAVNESLQVLEPGNLHPSDMWTKYHQEALKTQHYIYTHMSQNK